MDIAHYKTMLAQPWGKIQYDLIFAQLSHIKGQTVLDFGAGFGLTSQYLSQNNTVTAIEPNPDLLFDNSSQTFTKILGSLEVLSRFEAESFDLICCHNVLEYITPHERPRYLAALKSLLKPDGRLSIIKHNTPGKVLQSVVFTNNLDTALALLDGQPFQSPSFTQGQAYTLEDLLAESQMQLDYYQGLRTFYSLQPNQFKTTEDWLEKMTKMELAVCDQAPYKDVSFLQHIWLKP